MQPYLIVIIALAALLVLLFVFALLCDGIAFGRRYDKNPLLKYFTADDFGLDAEKAELPHGLNGFIYRKTDVEDNGRLIIFCHGMGPGHIAYTTEIAYFCSRGFTVLAIDSKGCNFSGGKSIKGMYSGVQTAIAAIDYARKDERLKGLKTYLVGHSWGAYSALCASAKRKVSGVVAISAPASPSKTVQEAAAASLSKPFAAILRPFWWFINFLKYGAKGNSNAAACARKNSTPTLLVQGDCDKIVTPSKSVFGRAEGQNITKFTAEGKAHNPYNTVSAEKLLGKLSLDMKNGVKDFSEFDFTAATEEDSAVMQTIYGFITKS